MGRETKYRSRARSWMEESREALERGRLSSSVGAEKPDHLSGLDREADAVDGLDVRILSPKEAPHSRSQTRFTLMNSKMLGELVDFDGGLLHGRFLHQITDELGQISHHPVGAGQKETGIVVASDADHLSKPP